ncbi:hypothetical protein GH714_008324 [Hevea brasiliensis]|uniref:Uncharacterized protein n=1 Tax=Hevea brasiliensis TaxID=3981 RepID=A0A6A6MXI2_HEVBR|nr:hypothetical protein GH714_008324 [Hevea brasiliensis]
MVKAYLRYEPAASFGAIASIDSNMAYDISGKHLLAAALEKVRVWRVRHGMCTKTLVPSTSLAVIPPSPSPLFHLLLRLWQFISTDCIGECAKVTFESECRLPVDPEPGFYLLKHELVDGQGLSNENRIEIMNNGDSSSQNKWEVLKLFGEVQRQNKDRVATVRFNKSENLLACQVAGKTVDIFWMKMKQGKAKRRVHRKKEKKSARGAAESTEIKDATFVTEEDGGALTVTVPDVFRLLQTVRASKKIFSIAFNPITLKNSLAILALSLNNNLLEFYSIESNTV